MTNRSPDQAWSVLRTALDEGVTLHPNATARFVASDRDVTLSASSIAENGALAVAGLRSLGLAQGDAVVVQLPNWPEYVVLFWAAVQMGLIFVPVVHTSGTSDLQFILEQTRAKVVVIPAVLRGRDFRRESKSYRSRDLQHVIVVNGDADEGSLAWSELLVASDAQAAQSPSRPSNDTAFIVYTSGSTGNPKGVRHSELSVFAAVTQRLAHSGDTDGGIIFMPLPFGHFAGIVFSTVFLLKGSHFIFLDTWDSKRAAELIVEEGVVSMPGTPYHFLSLLEAVDEFHIPIDCLKGFWLSSTAVPPSLVELADGRGIAAFRGYGSSEHPNVSWGRPTDAIERRSHTDGQIVGDNEVLVIDDDDRPVATNEDGHILTRGTGMFLGYVDSSFDDGVLTSDGWYRTGDIGHVDEEKHLTISGRQSELIIRGGENLSPKEIEDVLSTHPDVRAVAVMSYPHERLGEIACAIVEPVSGHNDLTLDVLAAHVRFLGLAKHKSPEMLVVVDELPRTSMGKVNRGVLRQALDSGELHPKASSTVVRK